MPFYHPPSMMVCSYATLEQLERFGLHITLHRFKEVLQAQLFDWSQ